MVDLSHWDFAEQFSAYDAAALILGVEPRESQDEEGRVRVVAERMEIHYNHTLKRRWWAQCGPSELEREDQESPPAELASVVMERLYRRSELYGEDAPYETWLNDRREPKFENQEFSRAAVAGWLTSIGLRSAYLFDRKQDALPANQSRWPWGVHHTEALGHLEAAARRFWVNYDPTDATTAPTNATVSEWLKKELRVSGTMSEAIASMLRPDGLPTGPRK